MDLTEEGFVKRIRGVAYATRVSPSMSNRIVDSARGVLNNFIPVTHRMQRRAYSFFLHMQERASQIFLAPYPQDVYIYTDHYRGPDSGNSPGYGLSLVAGTLATKFCWFLFR